MDLIKPVFAQAQGLPYNPPNLPPPQNIGNNYGFGGSNYTSFGQFFTSLIGTAFGVVGALLVIYMIWGGFKWLTSGGNKEAVSSAQQMITHAVIGVALLVLIFILFRFIPEAFGVTLNIFG